MFKQMLDSSENRPVEWAVTQFIHCESILRSKYPDMDKRIQRQEMECMVRAMTEDIERMQEEEENPTEQKYRPSSLGSCERALVLKMIGAPKTHVRPDPMSSFRQQMTFAFGNALNYWMAAVFERMGVMEARELVVNVPELSVQGRVDFVLSMPEHLSYELDGDELVRVEGGDNIRLIVDMKSAKADSFKKMALENEEYLYGYIMQQAAYSRALDLPAILLVVNKDTSEVREVPLVSDESVQEVLEEIISKTKKAVKSLTVPERPYTSPYKFPCSFCNYSSLCFDDVMLDLFLEEKRRETKQVPKAPAGRKLLIGGKAFGRG